LSGDSIPVHDTAIETPALLGAEVEGWIIMDARSRDARSEKSPCSVCQKERSMRERITSLSVTVAIRSGTPGTLQAANQGEASAGQGQVSLGNSRWRGVH